MSAKDPRLYLIHIRECRGRILEVRSPFQTGVWHTGRRRGR
jgi:hypothetical protein